MTSVTEIFLSKIWSQAKFSFFRSPINNCLKCKRRPFVTYLKDIYNTYYQITAAITLVTFKKDLRLWWKTIKVGLSPSKKKIICFIDTPSKFMQNAYYFILKALFVLKIFKFLSSLFRHAEKTAWLERYG